MPFEFGEVILVPFPFTDQTASKKRPAVIVSNIAYSNVRPDVVLMAITSQLRQRRRWAKCGLPNGSRRAC
jgi:mRNA interferase MazF